ncbi:hypothetical protein F5Y16DRAFT_278388 [Xylariaceae sp. FL0255]|nr:hypothetical protein F5Y16DRAFT_278388 [Xylariaceae sp. FL0255]
MSVYEVKPGYPQRVYLVSTEAQDAESPPRRESLGRQPSGSQWEQQQTYQPEHQHADQQPSQTQWPKTSDPSQQDLDSQFYYPPADQEPFQSQTFARKNELSQFFPKINDKDSLRAWKSKRSRTLLLQIFLVVVVLLANIVLTVFAVSHYSSTDGIGLLYDDDCTTVKDLDRYLHLLINILSTGLLSASNYCMQLQAAPTRAEINRAHHEGKWLDIGVSSLRNLAFISNWRRFTWALLALSSVPVHLIYNSAVFQTLASNEYAALVVKDSFVNGSSWSIASAQKNQGNAIAWNQSYTHPVKGLDNSQLSPMIQDIQKAIMNNTYTEMNISACFDMYNDYFAAQGNVVVLVQNQSVQSVTDDSLLMYQYIIPGPNNYPKNMWMSSNGSADWVAVEPPTPVTTLFLGTPHYEMKSCLVQPPNEDAKRCFLQYSPPILYIIIGLNILKTIILFCVWGLRRWQEQILEKQEAENAGGPPRAPQNQVIYTLGDAISSFLREPAPETTNRCLATREEFLTKRTFKNHLIKERPDLSQNAGGPRPFKREDRYWMSAASPRRWLVLIALCLGIILLTGVLLGLGIISLKSRNLSTDISGLSALGFGSLGQYTFLNSGLAAGGAAGFVKSVLVANLPQLIISFLYLFYNSMVSTFLVQREFSRMHLEKNRKTLRVSEPVGIQRSSYFISLPLKYGIPLYASSALLHWLASQSLFLARITSLNPNGSTDDTNSFSDPANSPLAIFITILVGLAFLLVVIFLGCRKYDGTMRMVATNSLAISAACHALQDDRADAYQLPIRWAVVGIDPEGVGHCSFTTAPDAEVRPPREGSWYQ